jgi:hypothetical protein
MNQGYCLEKNAAGTTTGRRLQEAPAAEQFELTSTDSTGPSSTSFSGQCSVILDETDCDSNQECEWVNVPANNTPSSETPLFTTEFCHPLTSDQDDWSQCITKDVSDCETPGNECKWSNGKGLIPYHDFCAPVDLTDDVSIIKMCIEKDT